MAETQSLAADECELMRAKCVDGMKGLSARTQDREGDGEKEDDV
jgi:hypothetical protein